MSTPVINFAEEDLNARQEAVDAPQLKPTMPLQKATIGLLVSLLISPGLGVMIGLSLYLPFEYMIVFGLGGILSIFIGWKFGARFAEDKGVPIAAGLIVGDALVGIVHAIYKVAAMSLGG